MFRLINLVWLALVAAAVAGTFAVKEQVRREELELARLQRAIAEERDAIRMLAATWSFLNQPDHLKKLAGGGTDLAPVGARAVLTLDRLAERLASDARVAERSMEAVAAREDIAAFERRRRAP